MRLTKREFYDYLRPLLPEADLEIEPDRAFALAAFSFLTEPSDLLPQFLSEWLTPEALLDLVIDRADAQALAATLPAQALEAVEDKLGDGLAVIWGNALERWTPRLNRKSLLDSLAWMVSGASGLSQPHRLVFQGSDSYPLGLDDLNTHRPGVLWCIGQSRLLAAETALAVVGTRQASRYGSSVAADIAAVAAQAGVVTVSGGAYGIDAIVHQSAVQLEAPTIAFMAGGLGYLYPRGNLGMLHAIASAGLLVSEVAPFVTPAKWRFLMRNRLIAATAAATVVVEAGKTSGALNTGRTAVGLGREVAVVPGNIDSARSIGCHQFLNEFPGDVKLLARPQDVLKLLGAGVPDALTVKGLGALESRALDTFGLTAIEAWEVQRLAGLTTRETQIALGSLEMQGLVERLGTGYRRVLPEGG